MRARKPETHKQACCRIVERNDVLGTCTTIHSPQSVSDAMRNHGALLIAQDWIEREDFSSSPAEPITVSIRRNDHVVVIHWHATGDIDDARRVMRQVLDGVWRCEL